MGIQSDDSSSQNKTILFAISRLGQHDSHFWELQKYDLVRVPIHPWKHVKMEKKTPSEPRRRKIHRSVSCSAKGTTFIGENYSEISGKPLSTEHQSDEVDSKTGHHDLKQTETFKTRNKKKALYNKLRR